MGQYNVCFSVIENLKYNSDGFPFASSYDFWTPLVLWYLKDCDTIRFDCWIDDENAISRVLPYAKKIDKKSIPYMTIVCLDITIEVVEDLIKNPLDDEQKIAWFSVFLEKEGRIIFSSSHYGIELSVSGVNEQELEFLRSLITPDFSFHIWDCSDMNNTDDYLWKTQ